MAGRLDALQTELNRKTDESIELHAENNGLKATMKNKNSENSDLLDRVFGLEKKTLDLEMELSAYRASQQNESKENRRKSGNAISPRKKSSGVKSVFM